MAMRRRLTRQVLMLEKPRRIRRRPVPQTRRSSLSSSPPSSKGSNSSVPSSSSSAFAKSTVVSACLGGALIVGGTALGAFLHNLLTQDQYALLCLWRESDLDFTVVSGIAMHMMKEYRDGMDEKDLAEELHLAPSAAGALLRCLDVDKTGRLETREVVAAAVMLAALEGKSNGSGEISLEQIAFQFKVFDVNNDGWLSAKEIERLLLIEKSLGLLPASTNPAALTSQLFHFLGKENAGEGSRRKRGGEEIAKLTRQDWMKLWNAQQGGLLAKIVVAPWPKPEESSLVGSSGFSNNRSSVSVVVAPPDTVARDVSIGTTVGMFTTLFAHPFDTVKTRMQLHANASTAQGYGFWGTMTSAIRNEGLGCLYKGLYGPIVATGTKAGLSLFAKSLWARTLTENCGMDKKSSITQAVAGGLTGLSMAPILVQSELVKIRLQANESAAAGGGPIAVFQKMWLQEGSGVLVLGLLPTALRLGSSWAVFFAGHDAFIQRIFARNDGTGAPPSSPTYLEVLGGGAIVGIASWIVSLPFDVVKTRMQADPVAFPSFVSTWRTIAKTHGVRGFYAVRSSLKVWRLASSLASGIRVEKMPRASRRVRMQTCFSVSTLPDEDDAITRRYPYYCRRGLQFM
eukprot:jgi/Bigna1/82136/fgenesh1_pg.88_\